MKNGGPAIARPIKITVTASLDDGTPTFAVQSNVPQDRETIETLCAIVAYGAQSHHLQLCETLGMGPAEVYSSSRTVRDKLIRMIDNAESETSSYRAHETPPGDDADGPPLRG